MNFKKLLAENMLRFGTKNLSDALKDKLQEQVTQQVGGEKQIYSISDAEAAILKINPNAVNKINKNANTTSVETDDVKTNQSSAWRKELVDKFGQERYNQFMESLAKQGGSSPTTTTNVNIWFTQLTQESRIAFLTQFDAYIKALKTRKQDDDYLVRLAKGKVTREKITVPGEEPLPPITLAIDVRGKDVFVDNQSTITPMIQQAIDQLISDVKLAMLAVQGSDAKVTVTELSIAASSSRFRNTKEAGAKTWAQLSKERGANAQKAIVDQLTALGITVPANVITLKGGLNPSKDGTSGPNPPRPYALSPDGISIDTSPDPELKKRNEYGATLATKEAYDDYKFLVVTCIAEVTYAITAPVIVPDEVASRGYNMLITAYKKPGTIKFPRTTKWFDLPKKMPTVQKGKSAKPTLAKCMEW
jgi:hypothetical protein